MRKVRWAGWTMAVAMALAVVGGQAALADIASDKPAALLVYPKINVGYQIDTVIRLTNTQTALPVMAHCFYTNANTHCTKTGQICSSDPEELGAAARYSWSEVVSPLECAAHYGSCAQGWIETDFWIVLTPGQPIQWSARDGLSSPPIPTGRCLRDVRRVCGTDDDCNPFPGGPCTPSNAGTRIPPVAEVPYQGELRCVVVDENGNPTADNVLKGETQIFSRRVSAGGLDVASYNAIGIQATGNFGDPSNELVIGPGFDGEYNGCPNYVILDHFFDYAIDPVYREGQNDTVVTTDLTLVPCSADYLRQIGGVAVVQYLVFNEFEQRFSTSRPLQCYSDLLLSGIDTVQPTNSIFNVGVAGTLTGQTRLNAITDPTGQTQLSGVLAVAVERHSTDVGIPAPVPLLQTKTGGFNTDMAGTRPASDIIWIP
jgi:hypothetical protein